jgi:hypothetical protein
MSTHVEVLVPVQPARALLRAHDARVERRRLVREAIELRHLAYEMESSMPSMAADLRRAADGVF